MSRVLEIEVSALTNAGQIPYNTEGNGPCPTTEFRSMAISLELRVNSKTKAKKKAKGQNVVALKARTVRSLSPGSYNSIYL